MASNWSVILARALTTTTGFSFSLSRTMAATRSMASASCTEVPPNFMTIIAAPWELEPLWGCDQGQHARQFPSAQISLGFEQLAVQYRSAGSSANGVVGQDRKFPVKDVART